MKIRLYRNILRSYSKKIKAHIIGNDFNHFKKDFSGKNSIPYMTTEIIENVALLVVFLFLMVYVVFGILNRNGYLATRPRQNPSNPTKQRDNSEVIEEFNEWHREQTFSATLAGFSLTALVFVLGFEDVLNLQRMVEFFVIGFTLEMLSFLSYKYMIKRGYEYFGTIFQFSGLLAMG